MSALRHTVAAPAPRVVRTDFRVQCAAAPAADVQECNWLQNLITLTLGCQWAHFAYNARSGYERLTAGTTPTEMFDIADTDHNGYLDLDEARSLFSLDEGNGWDTISYTLTPQGWDVLTEGTQVLPRSAFENVPQQHESSSPRTEKSQRRNLINATRK